MENIDEYSIIQEPDPIRQQKLNLRNTAILPPRLHTIRRRPPGIMPIARRITPTTSNSTRKRALASESRIIHMCSERERARVLRIVELWFVHRAEWGRHCRPACELLLGLRGVGVGLHGRLRLVHVGLLHAMLCSAATPPAQAEEDGDADKGDEYEASDYSADDCSHMARSAT